MEINEDAIQLRGIEKAAVLFLCLNEDIGSRLMEKLGDENTRALFKMITTLGMIPAKTVEAVIRDFSNSVNGNLGVMGSVEAAKRMLSRFKSESEVREYLDEISGPRDNKSVWEDFAGLNEQVIVNYLRPEKDQTVAAIIYRLNQVNHHVAASVLTKFGQDRMIDIAERMMTMESLPRHIIQDIEEGIASELLGSAVRKSGPDTTQRLADMFNKMDPDVFESFAASMEKRSPQSFGKIKEKMFTFDDLMRLNASDLQRIIRNCNTQTLALALRGAKKDLRDTFLSPNVMTQRARDDLKQEISNLGGIRLSDAREAQSKILELTFELVSQGLIRLPSEDDKIIEGDL